MTLAWHFTADKLRDGSPIPRVGEWLEFTGEIRMCESGLHASRDPLDALQYAPGPLLHRVECDEIAEEGDDKLVCSRRRIIASRDMTEYLLYFARMRALSVYGDYADNDGVILEWLLTGNECLRSAAAAAAARSAASSAAWSAAVSAASSAAWSVASSAAWSESRADFNELVEEAFSCAAT